MNERSIEWRGLVLRSNLNRDSGWEEHAVEKQKSQIIPVLINQLRLWTFLPNLLYSNICFSIFFFDRWFANPTAHSTPITFPRYSKNIWVSRKRSRKYWARWSCRFIKNPYKKQSRLFQLGWFFLFCFYLSEWVGRKMELGVLLILLFYYQANLTCLCVWKECNINLDRAAFTLGDAHISNLSAVQRTLLHVSLGGGGTPENVRTFHNKSSHCSQKCMCSADVSTEPIHKL